MDIIEFKNNSGESVSIPFKDLDSAIRLTQAIFQRNTQQYVVDQPAIGNQPPALNRCHLCQTELGIQRKSLND
jgi:hypothetical protein